MSYVNKDLLQAKGILEAKMNKLCDVHNRVSSTVQDDANAQQDKIEQLNYLDAKIEQIDLAIDHINKAMAVTR